MILLFFGFYLCIAKLQVEYDRVPLMVASNEGLPHPTYSTAKNIEDIIFGQDVSGLVTNSCSTFTSELVWMNQLNSKIYSTPIISDFFGDGVKEIIFATFERDIVLLDHDGYLIPEWPYVKDNTYFHSSPLIYDYNKDGTMDILLSSFNAEIFIIDTSGTVLMYPFVIPKLLVHKKWYEGLDDVHVVASMSLNDHESHSNPDQKELHPTHSRLENNSIQLVKDDKLTKEGKESFQLLFDNDEQERPEGREFVQVDSHILTTPVLADINGDGIPELIVAVTYFFDQPQYEANSDLFSSLDVDIDISKYVAGGIVVIDLHNKSIIWNEHLDLTTIHTKKTAFLYSSPTIIDLDGDGGLEIIIGTGLGFVYVLRASDGKLVKGWPIQVGEIQAQISCEDINGDGELELIIMDSNEDIFCVNMFGELLWKRNIGGYSVQAATFGDINGDGNLEIVIGTLRGSVFALKGSTGEILKGFPIITGDKISAPITLINLNPDIHTYSTEKDSSNGLSLVFPSFDGHVYIINGIDGCISKIDIGEHSYAMILFDDIIHNDRLDFLVSTMSGHAYCFTTNVPYYHLRTWLSPSSFTSRDSYVGVQVSPNTRYYRDISGRQLYLEIEIIDNRKYPESNSFSSKWLPRKYHIDVSLAGSVILYSNLFTESGTKSIWIDLPNKPNTATLYIRMTNEHNQVFEDQISLSFNLQFFLYLRWLLFLPFVSMSLILMIIKNQKRRVSLDNNQTGIIDRKNHDAYSVIKYQNIDIDK